MLGCQREELLLAQNVRESEALFSENSPEELKDSIWSLKVLSGEALKGLWYHNRVTFALAEELGLRFKFVSH